MEEKEIKKRILCTSSSIVIIGASSREKRPVFSVMKYLAAVGHSLYPVNPTYAGEKILGFSCVSSIKDLSVPADIVALFISPSLQKDVVEDLILFKERLRAKRGPALVDSMEDPILLKEHTVIWFQPGSENPYFEGLLQEKGFHVISHACMMMDHRRNCSQIR